jgi:hypothetical protein
MVKICRPAKMSASIYTVCTFLLVFGSSLTQTFQGLKQETVVNKNFGTILGTRDVIIGYQEDFRIPQETIEYSQKPEVYQDAAVEIPLGVASWAPVQISALMQSVSGQPEMAMPVCSVQEEGLDYEVKSILEMGGSDFIYDYEIMDNIIYIITSKYELEVVKIEEQKGQTYLSHAWVLPELDKKSRMMLGTVFQEAGLAIHRQTGTIYMPTNVGLLKIDSKTKLVTSTGKNIYVNATEIVYTDILQDYLFVGFKNSGVYVYNIKDPENIKKLGVFDKAYFGIKQEDKFVVNHFFVNLHLVQKYQTENSKQSKPDQVGDKFFIPKNNIAPNHDVDALGFPVLLVASNIGVHMIDITTIKENGVMPTITNSVWIPLADAVKVTRYHNTIYILQKHLVNSTDTVGLRSTLSEVILIEPDESRYRSTTPSKELYKFNRQAHMTVEINNIFTDADFFYMIGTDTHYVFPRGVPSDSQSMIHNLGKTIHEPNIHGLLTLHIGSETSLLAFGPQTVVDSRLKITDPYLLCTHNGKHMAGEHKMEVNVTTLNCPQKQTNPKIDFKMRVTNTCRWSRTLTINFYDSKKYGYGLFGKTLRVVEYLILIAFILLAVGICFFFRRNRLIQAEYERLKREIGGKPDGMIATTQEAEYYNNEPNKSGIQQVEFGQVTGAASGRPDI